MGKELKEFFFFPDIGLMSIVFIALSGAGLFQADSVWDWLAFPVGALLFAAFEYATHRFLFHLPPPKSRILLKLLRRLHYDHHERPDELKLLFLPVWYSGPQLALIAGIVYGITEDAGWSLLLTAGAVLGLLHYEWTHFVAHRPIRPLTGYGRKLKRQHLLHHFKNENYWFGVTHTVSDRLFGTLPDEKSVETSPTARKLAEK
jgi:4-hydroxysphinganine ceramide fatty acyl 2-hydroxylase